MSRGHGARVRRHRRGGRLATSRPWPGEFVVGSFFASDNTCEICRAGYQSSLRPPPAGAATGAQAEYCRIPLADGTLVATPDCPTRHRPVPARRLRRPRHRVVRRRRGRGRARQDGRRRRRRRRRAARRAGREAARRRADHRDEPPRRPRRRSPASSARPTSSPSAATRAWRRIKELTDGLGAHSVIEAVGTQESMMQAIRVDPRRRPRRLRRRRPRRRLPGLELFFSDVHLHGGPAPVRRFLPELIDLIWNRADRPGEGLRPRAAPRRGRRGLQGHGRAPRHQGPAHHLTHTEEPRWRSCRPRPTWPRQGTRRPVHRGRVVDAWRPRPRRPACA